MERRANSYRGEAEEARTSLESADRARKASESELSEAMDRVNELTAQIASVSGQKRKLDNDVTAMQV